jgi:hypothetical protein
MVARLNQYIARSWRRLLDVEARIAVRGTSRKNTTAALGAETVDTTASRLSAKTEVSPPQRT